MQKKTQHDFTPVQQKVMDDCQTALAKVAITPQRFATFYAPVPQSAFDVAAILRFLGLAALIAGFFAVVAMQWDAMSHPLRMLATFGPGLAGLGLAAWWQQLDNAPDTLPFLLLLLASAALLTHGIEAASALYRSDAAQFLGYAGASLPLLALLWHRQRPETLFATWFWLNTSLVTFAEWGDAPQMVILSLLAGTNALWGASLIRWGYPRLSMLADIITLIALTMLVWDQVGDLMGWNILLLLYGVGLLAVGMKTCRRLLLLWGAVQIFGSLMKYADFYFRDVIGWPLLIMGMGGVLIVMAQAMRRIWPQQNT